MTNNKSIDGLTTHDAKISASKSPKPKSKTRKTTIKVTTAPAPAQKTPKIPKTQNPQPAKLETEITDLEIEVTPDGATNISAKSLDITQSPTPPTPPKSKKSKPRTREQAVEDFLSPVQAFNFDSDSKQLTESEETVETMKTPKPQDQDQDPLESPKKDKKNKKDKKPKKKPSRVRRTISIISLVIVVALIGLVIWGILHINDILARINGGNVFDLFTFMDETYEPLKTDENGRTNILAFGTSGYNMDGDEGNGVHDGAQLTDSIMLISLDQATGDVAMLSLPRDLKASPTCTATGKINEVYWCNNMDGDNEQAGATALMEEVGDILGVDIQYYAHLNWGSLVSIVDTLDGINVTLDEDIEDYYYTGSVYEAGTTYTLDGIQAVALSRARHGTAGGDFSRGASQQKIIIGIKDKVLEKDLSISDMLSLASVLGDNLRTDLTISELKTLAHLTWDFDFNNMRTVSLYDPDHDINLMTTGTINDISYVLPSAGVGNYYAIQEYVAKMFSSDPRNYEDASIIILNSTDTAGLASDERATLTDAGYTITDIGDTSGNFSAPYTLYALNDQAPGTIKLLEEYYNISAQSADDLPADLPRDYDIIIVIGEPAAAQDN